METIHYSPARHDDGLMWGDYAMSRIEPGNRVDRFLSSVAYLDGEKPYAVFARGYYTRSTLVTYSWDGENLEEHRAVDSGWTPMSNPFNDGPHGVDGTDPVFGSITTQGAHSLSAADVDELTVPLVAQLENSLKQAIHHFEKGSAEDSLKFLEKLITDLNNKNNQKHISLTAKLNVLHHTNLIANMLDN